MPAPDEIRRSTAADGPAVVECLAAALAADPFFGWIWGGGHEAVRDGLRAWMTLVVERTADRAETWLAGDGAAAVIWIVPEAPLEGADYAAVAGLLTERLGEARAGEVMGAIGAAGAGVPATPHRTLLYVGVRPEAQGRGLGRQLVAPGLAAADTVGHAVQCNSTNPRNEPFYERLGFDRLGGPIATGTAPPIQPLWRPSRAG